MIHKALGFRDVLLLPHTPTRLNSRAEADTHTQIGRIPLAVPAIVPSMHSLVTPDLINNVEGAGGLVVQPRGMLIEAQQIAVNSSLTTAVDTAKRITSITQNGILSIEIANGHMLRMRDTIKHVRDEFGQTVSIWAGTVATPEGVEYLARSGADAAIIGIGVGSACTTTEKTGVGYPMLQTILDCANCSIPIISAGGIREAGDFVKAIAAGADGAMVGGLLAGCSDTLDTHSYWGMASEAERLDGTYIEGRSISMVPRQQASKDVIRFLIEALQSAMSYCDCYTLKEFRTRAKFVEVGNGY